MKFAKDEDIKVDLKVIAISNPYGLSFTVTEEIISVTNRKTPNLEIEFILIDVPINHRNSGKPLINSGKKNYKNQHLQSYQYRRFRIYYAC